MVAGFRFRALNGLGMQFIGNAISLFGLYLLWSVTFGDPGYRIRGVNWSLFFAVAPVGLVIAGFGAWLTERALKTTQAVKDGSVQQTFSIGKSRHFAHTALFLRPFQTSGRFIIEHQYSNAFVLDRYTHPGSDSLERYFADALSGNLELMGLGDRGNVDIGLSTGGFVDDWKQRILTAMEGAAYILVLPSANEGTLWEIGQIKERGYLGKALFIMPPILAPFKYVGAPEYPPLWSEAAKACCEAHGLRLPEYGNRGLLFRFDPTSLERYDVPFALNGPRNLARSINKLFS